MIITQGHAFYIYTSRDFSALLDKQVKVSYSGTLDNFTLLDITEK